MGLVLGSLFQKLNARETSDLTEEQVEEAYMVTSSSHIRLVHEVPKSEIHRIRGRYKAIAAQEDMTREEFYTIPGIAVNPLKDQLFKIFELTSSGRIPFIEFVRFVALYSYHSTQDAKLREAFRLQDLDGDGKISCEDLRKYLTMVYPHTIEDGESAVEAAKRREETVETVVSRILGESATDVDFLAFEDFVKIVQHTDFESRLILPF